MFTCSSSHVAVLMRDERRCSHVAVLMRDERRCSHVAVLMRDERRCSHVAVLMRDERRKEERSKQGQTNNKAKQHSTPKAVTFPKNPRHSTL